ncbi:MAG TPA: FlgD immunoglobulin-like domain containing protein, partial [Candidatus Eisenbacteria bacterium]|nr:FlgD immunoglobulin-like domain containing protein [Candidatus Eisenbacteria bacterium]
VRATDANGRLQVFTLQVRVGIRYLADGVEIVDGVFVSNSAMLRAEVTTPIPVTEDSLELLLDGVPLVVSKSGSGRQWVLQGLPGPGPGTHTLQVAVGGRTAGFDPVTFQVSAEFVMRGVAVVSPRIQGAGCGGSVFQYELSSAADRVELLLLTVAGRRVDTRQLTGNAGFNVYCWDGRDSQGHDTATGVYLYRLRATDATGKTVAYDGRMIRSR